MPLTLCNAEKVVFERSKPRKKMDCLRGKVVEKISRFWDGKLYDDDFGVFKIDNLLQSRQATRQQP